MAISSSGLLLDSSVVIRHFRGGQELLGALGSFELFYLPYVALAELYAGAYGSLRSERNLQISSFLDAVDVLLPDEETPLVQRRGVCHDQGGTLHSAILERS
jgi:predicted nucleic acid-binding protein